MCLNSRFIGGGTATTTDSTPSWYDFIAGANAATLPSGMTFTRASSATRRNSSAVIVTETTDVPLWQFSISGVARGLRVMGTATNLVKQATILSGTSTTFSPARATVSAASTTSPDGTVNAPKIVEDTTATNTHYHNGSGLSATAGVVYTFSCYAKAAERSWVAIRVFATELLATSASAFFNLGTGATGTVSGALTAGIEDAGSGWYRCWVTFTAANTTVIGSIGLQLATGDNGATYTGDGTSGLYLWGAQFEAGDGPTSFIPTTTATVTRAIDVPLITNANALANQAWVIKARSPMFTPSGTQVLMSVDDGTANNRRYVWRNSSTQVIAGMTVAGVEYTATLGTVAADTDFAVAVRFADNNLGGSLSGAAIVKNTTCTNPLGLTTARVGQLVGGSHWNSTIRTILTQATASDTDLPLLAS